MVDRYVFGLSTKHPPRSRRSSTGVFARARSKKPPREETGLNKKRLTQMRTQLKHASSLVRYAIKNRSRERATRVFSSRES